MAKINFDTRTSPVQIAEPPEERFKTAMRNDGIEPPPEIIADGKLHRFYEPGHKPKSENGWYVYYDGDLAAGAYGCWKQNLSYKWCCKSYQTMTTEEKTRYRANMEAAKTAQEAERQRIQAECRKWCSSTWLKEKSADDSHPYLQKKGVKAHGLKTYKDSLIVPLEDLAGTIHGIQFIQPDGEKRFKTGTNKRGHFHTIGSDLISNTLIICEGYATGASIHEATGHCVIVAFDAGNLLPVTEAFHNAQPELKIILAADNDSTTEGNPGLTKATEAARAVSALLAIPDFKGVCNG